MSGWSRWRVAAGWQDPRGGRLPRQPQSPALPEQMAPGVSAGALLTLFSAGFGSRLPPAPPRGCGTAIPFVSDLRWLPRGHGHPAPRGRWLPATGAEGAGCARLGQQGGYLMGAGWGRTRAGQQCPASRVAILPRDAVLGFWERRQERRTSGGPRSRRAPVWLQCSSAAMLPIPKPITVVPGLEGAHWITQGLGTTCAPRVRMWNWKQ